MRRETRYRWRLRELMASRGLFATTQLSPLLAERGVDLSASQVHRLVTGTPERLSLAVLAALCDILEVTPNDLIEVTAENAAPRQTGTAGPVLAATDTGSAAYPGPSGTRRVSAETTLATRRRRPAATSRQDCPRCGAETRFKYRKVCLRCRIGDRVQELLDDGTGRARSELQPLLRALSDDFGTGTVQARWAWLGLPRTQELLTGLATGTLKMTHAALDELPDQQRIHHLRAMLVTAGCLPPVDPAVHGFGTWLHGRLNALTAHPYERVLRQFGVWHHLARMRANAQTGPLRPNARTYAQLEFNRAVEFCTWLAEQNMPIDQLTQTALDHYYQSLTAAHQQSLRGFLAWASTTNRMPRLRFTRPRYRVGEALTQQRRLELLASLLDATDQPLAARVASCILLLYAQPIPRILAITLDDITDPGHPNGGLDGEVLLRLGEPATPVPTPFSDLVLQLVAERTAAGGDRWLFTGRAPGKPVSNRGLTNHIRALGIPLRLARAAAIRQLVLDVPAPVVAQALGFHHTSTHRQNTHAGGTWNRYITTHQSRLEVAPDTLQ